MQEVEKLEREGAFLQERLDSLLLHIDSLQQANMSMKQSILRACQANGMCVDMAQLNSTIAHHRPAAVSDDHAVCLAASILTRNQGDVSVSIMQLLQMADDKVLKH